MAKMLLSAVVVIALSAGIFFASVKDSAPISAAYHTGTVVQTGIATFGTYHALFQIQISGYPTYWFDAPKGYEKEALAIVLSAQANNRPVKVYADLSQVQPIRLYNVFMQ